MSSANDGNHSRRCFLLGLVASTASGCAHWLPSRKEPEPRKSTILSQELAPDTVGIESILLRLSSVESQQMPDLWAYADEQVIAPEPRMLLDRNGLRAGKFSGQIPAIVQAWVAQNATRIEQDPMEQAGVVADVSSFSQLWRCRPDQRKVLTVRNLPKETVTLFYNEEGFRGGQFGQTRRSVVAKDSAIRTEERRETLRWESLSLMLNMQRGDCLMITATAEPRGIGEHFFRTRSKEGEIQDVILLVRVAELNAPDEFSVANNGSTR
jgi:hypothetical protein